MARSVTIAGGGVGIDTSDFRGLAKALRQADAGMPKQLRTRLRAAGEVVATEARKIAAEHSTQIPPTIKVRTAGTTVAVVAGGADTPLAGLYELGNVRGGSKSAKASARGTFRHPVFGKDVWVDQPMHRFLRPAAVTALPLVEKEIKKALDGAGDVVVHAYKDSHGV